jgi:hypothetical protein
MKIITFSQKVKVTTTNGAHVAQISANPGERLLFDDINALSIQQDRNNSRYIGEITDLGPLLAEMYTGKGALAPKDKVLLFRNRGIGDQLIMSGASRYLREMLGIETFQLCDQVHEPVWAFNPYIGGAALSVPMHLDSIWRAKGQPFFNRAYFIESLCEWDNDSEQPNVYDRMFGMLGIEATSVPDRFKRPVFALDSSDIEARLKWLAQVSAVTRKTFKGGYIFVQIAATNKPRSLPPAVIEKILEAAQERDLPILVADDKPLEPPVAQLVAATKLAVNVAQSIKGIRLLGSLIAGATLVIGPDSCALHFAAAAETPAIGIWGPFSPESRCRYYPNQVHLFHAELCRHAPCFNYLPDLPIHKCPRGAAQGSCELFEGVRTDEIREAMIELLDFESALVR